MGRRRDPPRPRRPQNDIVQRRTLSAEGLTLRYGQPDADGARKRAARFTSAAVYMQRYFARVIKIQVSKTAKAATKSNNAGLMP